MTLLTVDFDVRSRQRELGVAMIECRLFPIDRIVTDRAVVREVVLHVVGLLIVVVLMTRPAIGGSAVIDAADVAIETFHLDMRASEPEVERVMIKGRLFPAKRVVTDRAVVREAILHVVGLLIVT